MNKVGEMYTTVSTPVFNSARNILNKVFPNNRTGRVSLDSPQVDSPRVQVRDPRRDTIYPTREESRWDDSISQPVRDDL